MSASKLTLQKMPIWKHWAKHWKRFLQKLECVNWRQPKLEWVPIEHWKCEKLRSLDSMWGAMATDRDHLKVHLTTCGVQRRTGAWQHQFKVYLTTCGVWQWRIATLESSFDNAWMNSDGPQPLWIFTQSNGKDAFAKKCKQQSWNMPKLGLCLFWKCSPFGAENAFLGHSIWFLEVASV